MSRKAFLVQVELDIQAVTCPGVWLCSNGRVALQIYMLDSCVQTASYKPVFPIKSEENFLFSKTFASKHRLNDLQKQLHEQWIYIEFVQWQNCEIGNVLATFQTTLDELLFPSSFNGAAAGVDLDLLMEATKIFPGTIAPKIEISTKTTIEETICKCSRPDSSTIVINPKVLLSAENKGRRNRCSNRKVCHSMAYSQRKPPCRSPERPPFRYKKVEDSLITRMPQNGLQPYDECSCKKRRSKSQDRYKCAPFTRKQRLKKSECPITVRICACGSGQKENSCPVCAKYEGYFGGDAPSCSPSRKKNTLVRSNLYPPSCACRSVAVSLKDRHSDANLSDNEPKRKICFCNCDDLNKKQSLAQKLHARLASTLNSVSCTDYDYTSDNDDGDGYCQCDCDLGTFYSDFYDKSKNKVEEFCQCQCVPDRSDRNDNENRRV